MAKTKVEIIDEVLLNDGEVSVALRRLAGVSFDIAAYNASPKNIPITQDEISMAIRLIRELRAGIFHVATTDEAEAV